MGLKRSILVLAILLCPTLSLAQTTTVTATITDSDSQTWNNGTAIITFVPPPGVSGPYYIDGVLMTDAQKGPFNVALNGGGTFTTTVTDTNHISPAGAQWLFTLCANTSASCSPVSIPVVGTSVNLSSLFSTRVTAPRFPAKGTGYYGYSDVEVNQIPGPGGSYFNVSSGCVRVWNGSVFNCSTGGSPGGSNPQVQFNNGGNFGGDSRLTFNTSTGALTDTGSVVAGDINNIVTVDGQKYTTANAALADPVCTTGCTIDMRGNSSPAALSLGAFDPSAAKVTLLLGPFAYTASSITLRNYLHILGAARGSTTIQSTSTTTPIFAMGGTTGIVSTDLENFVVYCGAGNSSQIAFNIVAQINGGGLNNASFKDLTVGGDGTHECGGESFLFDGSAGGSPPAINQFINFTNVQAFRKNGGAPALHIRGVNGQMFFANSQFDGSAPRDTLPNAVIEDSAFAGFTAAYSIAFYETTFQRGGTAIKLRGSTDVSCDNCHFEDVTGIIDAAVGQHYGNFGTHILHSYCATLCAQSSGSGFLTKTDASSQLAVDYLSLFGTPDNYWTGSSIVNLEHKGLYNFSSGSTYPSPNSSFRIPVGIDSDSPGIKFAATPTGNITAGAYAEVDITWATPFVDGSYVPVCTVVDHVTGTTSAGLRFERLNGTPFLSASGLTAVVFNGSGITLAGSLQCIAIHI